MSVWNYRHTSGDMGLTPDHGNKGSQMTFFVSTVYKKYIYTIL